MPVSSLLQRVVNRITVKVNRLTDPNLARQLGQELANDIVGEYFASGMSSQTGNTVDALSHVGQPEKTALGWKIGVVGNKSRTGEPSASSPKGTIRDFIEWYNKQQSYPKFFIKGGIPSQFAWWMLSRFQKQVLQQQRLAGRFGGESAAGVGRVPYVWGHEQGNPAANIRGRRFIENGTAKWRQRVPSIINEWYRSA